MSSQLPVRRFGIGEDDADALVFLVRVAPDVEVALGRSGRCAPGRLEPGVLIGGVVDDELGDDPEPEAVRFGDEAIEVLERAVARMDVLVVGDVVAVVLERRRVEREQPEAVDAEPLQVLELLRQALEVPDAVVAAVEERTDVRLIDDGVFVPESVGHRSQFAFGIELCGTFMVVNTSASIGSGRVLEGRQVRQRPRQSHVQHVRDS